MLAYDGWKNFVDPPLPPFEGKGAWLRSILYDSLGPFGYSGFTLLMSFAFFALLALIILKRKTTKSN